MITEFIMPVPTWKMDAEMPIMYVFNLIFESINFDISTSTLMYDFRINDIVHLLKPLLVSTPPVPNRSPNN